MDYAQRTAMIYGVTGQDGSYLAEHLLGLGYKVVGVTRRCSVDNTINIKGVLSNPNFLLLEGEVSDYLSVSGTLKKAEVFFDYPREVYSLAAQSHVGLSFEQPINAFRINAEGPLNILYALKELGFSHTRFYQASTSEMFGNEPGPQSEITPLKPTSPYAIAKLAAHHTVKMFRDAYGMFACAGILFNHESPRRGANFVTRKITMYVARLLQWKKSMGHMCEFRKLKLGNLNACRDWGYSPDYVRAMHMMLQQDTPEDYVIGTGETHSVREFCEYAFNYVGCKNWENYVDVDVDCLRPSDVNYLLSDPSKAMNQLNWHPQVTFKELVEIMMRADLDEIHCS